MLSAFLIKRRSQLLIIPIIVIPSILFLIYIRISWNYDESSCVKAAKQNVLMSKTVRAIMGGDFEISRFPDIIQRNDSVYYRVRVSGNKISKDILCIINCTRENKYKLVSIEEDNGRFRRENANSKWLIEYH